MNKNWKLEDDENIALFSSLYKQHGSDPQALNWGSREKQELRFRVLSEIGIEPDSSVMDIGCGLGDFCGWLKKQGIKTDFTGVDITEAMVEHSRKTYPDAKFTCLNVLEMEHPEEWAHDYVFASGLFSKRAKAGMPYMKTTIERMFLLCRKGLAFNSLSGWADSKEEGEFHPDPAEVLTFCKSLSRRVMLRHDYHPGDFTVYIYREEG